MAFWNKKTAEKFFSALEAGDMNVIRTYVEGEDRGKWISLKDKNDRSPIFIAAEKNHMDAIRLLKRYGADINTQLKGADTPLIHAVALKKINLVKCLVELGADANIPNHELCYPLHWAADHGEMQIFRALVETGKADINVRAGYGDKSTPLHLAVDRRNMHIVEYLLEKGARTDITDGKGRTPEDLAKEKGFNEITALFEKHKSAQIVQAAQAPAEAPPPAPVWAKSGDDKLVHTEDMPEAGRRLIEIFNFARRHRIVTMENLKTGTESTSPPEKFELIDDQTLEEAVKQFHDLGGQVDEADVFKGRMARKDMRL